MEDIGMRIRSYIRENTKMIVKDIVTLVMAQSPSGDKEHSDYCADRIIEMVRERIGVQADILEQSGVGNHLVFHCGNQDAEEQVMAIAHYDTVWDIDRIPLRIEGDTIYGPGGL